MYFNNIKTVPNICECNANEMCAYCKIRMMSLEQSIRDYHGGIIPWMDISMPPAPKNSNEYTFKFRE